MPADVKPCRRCGGTGTLSWYNVTTGRMEVWPCVICRAAEFDEREAAEGLNPNTSDATEEQ